MTAASSIRINYQMACPLVSRQGASIVAHSPTCIDVRKVATWIGKLDQTLPRFNKIVENGSLGLLEKEIHQITPLLAEGQEIVSSTSALGIVVDMINRLAKPRLIQLQQLYSQAQIKVGADLKLKSADERLEKKWEKLGFPPSVLEYHMDCAHFLIKSGLGFAIAGYRETTDGNANIHDLKLDIDGHPMIKMEGRFVRWETIKKELEFDPLSDQVKSRGYPGHLVQTWNYFHPQGLMRRDRFDYDKAYPTYQLCQDEYDRLIAHSQKFYETNRELDPGIPKDCVVQFFTSPKRQGIPDHPLCDNLFKGYPVHIGIRLITADKQVYSFGYQMLFEEQEFVHSDYFSTFLTTALAKVTMRDYEEFRPYEERVVTSVPLSSERSQNVLNLLNTLNQKQLRFQFMRQNCTSFMQEVMQCVGHQVNIRTTGGRVLADLLPNLNQFPLIGPLVAKIEDVARRTWEALPKFITHSLKTCRKIVFYLPEKLGTVLVNLLALKMGAAKKTAPLEEGTEDEELYDKKGLQNFSNVIRSWMDIFKDETSAVNHSKFFLEWQKQQRSTFIAPKSSVPKLTILPPLR